jgi:hypothetical protein
LFSDMHFVQDVPWHGLTPILSFTRLRPDQSRALLQIQKRASGGAFVLQSIQF